MNRRLLFACGLAAAVIGASCNKQEEPVIERLEFDSKDLATCIGTQFSDFLEQNEKYQSSKDAEAGVASLYASFKTSDDVYNMTVEVNADKNGLIDRIDAVLDNKDESSKLWNYIMSHTDHLKLGSFLGTKFKGKIGNGVKQTIEETISLVSENGTEESVVCPIFAIVSGNTYMIPQLENETLTIVLIRNWYALDYSEAASLIGADYDGFAQANYILGNKLSAWGTNYVYFDYAKDPSGNVFHLDVNADADVKNIANIKATLDYEHHSDAAEQLAIWKTYALGDPALGLGTFTKAYTGSFGTVSSEFNSQQEAIDYVETNGRPGGFSPDVVVCYEKDGHTITVTLKSLYLVVLVK